MNPFGRKSDRRSIRNATRSEGRAVAKSEKEKRDSKRVYTDRAWKQRACTVDEDNHGDDENAL